MSIGQRHRLRDPAAGKADTLGQAAQVDGFATLIAGREPPGDAVIAAAMSPSCRAVPH